MVSKFSDALTSVTLVPLPPKSHSAMMPAAGRPGAVCSALNAATESGISVAGTPSGARLGLTAQRPPQGTEIPGPQCAGTATATGAPPPTARAIVSRASTSTLFTAVCRTVGRDQRNRIADPVDETAQHQTRLAEVGVLGWNTDLGGAVVEQRQYRPTHDRRIADACGHQVGHADRQPECVAHFMYPRRWPFPTIAAAVLTITYIPLVVSKPLMPSPLTA